MDPKEIEREIRKLQQELKKLKAMKKFMEETECPPCDFAVASSMIAQCYPDPSKGEKMREKYLKGEITFRELLKGMAKNDEGCRYVYEFVMEQFDGVLDTKFTDWD